MKLGFDYKKLLGKIRIGERPRSDEIMRPHRDWVVILVGFLIFVAFIISFSIFVFFKINKGEFFTVAQSGGSLVDTLDRNKLKEVVEEFNAKQAKFSELKNRGPVGSDPSL